MSILYKDKIYIWFDGGFKSGQCYGSWEVRFCGMAKKVCRAIFQATKPSSNTAEYMALKDALGFLSTVADKRLYELEIMSDSMLVVMQLQKKWQCKLPHLQSLRDTILSILAQFGKFTIHWHGRQNNVARFGH